jgi:hypothetical protein
MDLHFQRECKCIEGKGKNSCVGKRGKNRASNAFLIYTTGLAFLLWEEGYAHYT